MARDQKCAVADLMADADLRAKIEISRYITDQIGRPTLMDILAELDKPGRDPRQAFEAVEFAEGVNQISDLKPGMEVPGIVTNVTAFGAFVDIGVHQDGLVHISELSDSFVREPTDCVNVQQKVKVRVIAVDLERKRISLSMKIQPDASRAAPQPKKTPRRHVATKRKKKKTRNTAFHNPFEEALRKKR
jgi:uncharacterized protein